MNPAHHGKFFIENENKFHFERLLIVEGIDDAYFFDKLLEILDADESTTRILMMKNNDVGNYYKSLSKQREIISGYTKKILFITDSDEDYIATTSKIINDLKRLDVNIDSDNLFHSVQNRIHLVGFTTLPSINENGNLERVCLRTLGNDGKLHLVKKFYESIEKEFGTLNKRYKRLSFIYLACVPNETRGVGKSFHDGIFHTDHECLTPIIDAIKEFLTN